MNTKDYKPLFFRKTMGYEKEYQELKHNHLMNSSEYYKMRAKLAFKRYFNNKDPGKVLDFGVGMGQNIFFLKDAVGYDISEFALKFCNKKGIKTIEDLKEIKKESMDSVISVHVFEHIDNPFETLKILKEKLKSGGKLILVVPALHHGKADYKPDSNFELFAWNFRTINNLLIKAGFRVVDNHFFRGAGYYKLLPFSRISTKLYEWLTSFLGRFRDGELKIVAIKP